MRNRWEINPYPDRGHRHNWKLAKRWKATGRWQDWFSNEWNEGKPAGLERECLDCNAKQTCSLTDEQETELVPGYEHLADVEWK